ncbi:MAG TPA: hypothetical protein VMB18_18435 [Terriglobales bacterium]|nr:hypothetical protein [Terriglobales bacterium]
MRIRRTLPIIFAVLAVAAAVTVAVVLRKHAPPEPARLLPDADGFGYLNLQWVRRINLLGQLPPVQHDPQYDQFIQAAGFDFERDLEQAAVAVHYPEGARPPRPEDVRFSYVIVAKINGDLLRQYLKKISSSIEDYRAIDIYNIPLEGRIGRVAILGVDTIAASNHPDPQVIRGIVDRSRKLASPFGGPRLLRQFYKHIPLASLGWAIFRVQPPEPAQTASGPSGWASFLFSKPAIVVASARYLGAIRLRAEAFTSSEEDAKQVTDRVATFLDLFHAGENNLNPSGFDADVKAVFASLRVTQEKDRAVLTATVPSDFLRKALTEPPVPATPEPPPANSPAAKPKAQSKSKIQKQPRAEKK